MTDTLFTLTGDRLEVEKPGVSVVRDGPAAEPFKAWLSEHGVNPGDVCLPGFVQREQMAVSFDSYMRDEEGRMIPDENRQALRKVRTVELDHAPAPWPAELVELAQRWGGPRG